MSPPLPVVMGAVALAVVLFGTTYDLPIADDPVDGEPDPSTEPPGLPDACLALGLACPPSLGDACTPMGLGVLPHPVLAPTIGREQIHLHGVTATLQSCLDPPLTWTEGPEYLRIRYAARTCLTSLPAVHVWIHTSIEDQDGDGAHALYAHHHTYRISATCQATHAGFHHATLHPQGMAEDPDDHDPGVGCTATSARGRLLHAAHNPNLATVHVVDQDQDGYDALQLQGAWIIATGPCRLATEAPTNTTRGLTDPNDEDARVPESGPCRAGQLTVPAAAPQPVDQDGDGVPGQWAEANDVRLADGRCEARIVPHTAPVQFAGPDPDDTVPTDLGPPGLDPACPTWSPSATVPYAFVAAPMDADQDGYPRLQAQPASLHCTAEGLQYEPAAGPGLAVGDPDDTNPYLPNLDLGAATDPESGWDSDGDGFTDYDETRNGSNPVDTSPNHPSTPLLDNDGDGTPNQDEPRIGSTASNADWIQDREFTGALCSGAYHVVLLAHACGGHGTQGSNVPAEAREHVARHGWGDTWLWDGLCLTQSLATCAGLAEHAPTSRAETAPSTWAGNAYGWRYIGNTLQLCDDLAGLQLGPLQVGVVLNNHDGDLLPDVQAHTVTYTVLANCQLTETHGTEPHSYGPDPNDEAPTTLPPLAPCAALAGSTWLPEAASVTDSDGDRLPVIQAMERRWTLSTTCSLTPTSETRMVGPELGDPNPSPFMAEPCSEAALVGTAMPGGYDAGYYVTNEDGDAVPSLHVVHHTATMGPDCTMTATSSSHVRIGDPDEDVKHTPGTCATLPANQRERLVPTGLRIEDTDGDRLPVIQVEGRLATIGADCGITLGDPTVIGDPWPVDPDPNDPRPVTCEPRTLAPVPVADAHLADDDHDNRAVLVYTSGVLRLTADCGLVVTPGITNQYGLDADDAQYDGPVADCSGHADALFAPSNVQAVDGDADGLPVLHVTGTLHGIDAQCQPRSRPSEQVIPVDPDDEDNTVPDPCRTLAGNLAELPTGASQTDADGDGIPAIHLHNQTYRLDSDCSLTRVPGMELTTIGDPDDHDANVPLVDQDALVCGNQTAPCVLHQQQLETPCGLRNDPGPVLYTCTRVLTCYSDLRCGLVDRDGQDLYRGDYPEIPTNVTGNQTGPPPGNGTEDPDPTPEPTEEPGDGNSTGGPGLPTPTLPGSDDPPATGGQTDDSDTEPSPTDSGQGPDVRVEDERKTHPFNWLLLAVCGVAAAWLASRRR